MSEKGGGHTKFKLEKNEQLFLNQNRLDHHYVTEPHPSWVSKKYV